MNKPRPRRLPKWSALLCLCVCIAWACSYPLAFCAEYFKAEQQGQLGGHSYVIGSARGVAYFSAARTSAESESSRPLFASRKDGWSRVGFDASLAPPYPAVLFRSRPLQQTRWGAVSSSTLEVGVPYWLLSAIAAVLPVRAIVRYRRFIAAERAARHPCTRCGYSLIGNTSGVCPECGMPVSKAQESRA